MRLKDKVSIITGAGRGIGQATALKFAREGAKVVVCDLTAESIAETVQLCEQAGAPTLGCVANVTDRASLDAMVAQVFTKWGRVDCLVNNAGIVADAQMKNMTEDQFDRVIDVNLKGVFNCTQAVVNIMIAQESGRVRQQNPDPRRRGQPARAGDAFCDGGVCVVHLAWHSGRAAGGHTGHGDGDVCRHTGSAHVGWTDRKRCGNAGRVSGSRVRAVCLPRSRVSR